MKNAIVIPARRSAIELCRHVRFWLCARHLYPKGHHPGRDAARRKRWGNCFLKGVL